MKLDNSFMLMITMLSATNGLNHFLEIRNRFIIAKEKLKLHEASLSEFEQKTQIMQNSVNNSNKKLQQIQTILDNIESKITEFKKR